MSLKGNHPTQDVCVGLFPSILSSTHCGLQRNCLHPAYITGAAPERTLPDMAPLPDPQGPTQLLGTCSEPPGPPGDKPSMLAVVYPSLGGRG